ncbi:MAG: hypothetical protein ACLQDQ_02645 [Myxococcaceae bacterium]
MAAPEQPLSVQPQIYKTQSSKRALPLPSPAGLARALANGVAGIAHAVTSGVQVFNQSLTDENVTARNLDNGLLMGSIAANARFLEELAKLPQRLYDDLRTSVAQNGMRAGKDFDYDSLATLVAAKLSQKSQPDTVPPARPPPSGRAT